MMTVDLNFDRSKRLDRPPQASKQRLRFSWGVSVKPSFAGHSTDVRQFRGLDGDADKLIAGRINGQNISYASGPVASAAYFPTAALIYWIYAPWSGLRRVWESGYS